MGRGGLYLTAILVIACVASNAQGDLTYIYGSPIALFCGGGGSSGRWYHDDTDLDYTGPKYTATATFEAQGNYRCTGNEGTILTVQVLGQIGVAPVPGTCATASTDTNSSCPVEVVRGGNLQLCIEHKTHPSDEHQTVEVDGAGWTDGTRRLVGCNAELCRNINVNPNYSSSGQWAKCLSVVSVTRSVNITYWITVNPDSTYPSDSPVSKTFTFAVRVVDAMPSSPSSSITMATLPSPSPTTVHIENVPSSPSSSITMATLPSLSPTTVRIENVPSTPVPSSSSIATATVPSPPPTTVASTIGGVNQDVIILAVVGIVLVLLILCAIGVVGGMIWRHRRSATWTSPSCSKKGHERHLTSDSEDQLKTLYIVPVISAVGEDVDTIDSGVLPHSHQGDESMSLFSPQQLDSGFHSISESIVEKGEGMNIIKTERPRTIVTRRGEPVSLKRKERESDRVSGLQDEDLFDGGLRDKAVSV